MAQTAMTVRLDNKLKARFDSLCEQFGMSANTAITIFVKAVIRSKSIPFSIVADDEESIRNNALESYDRMRRNAIASDSPELSLDDINAEIKAVRNSHCE